MNKTDRFFASCQLSLLLACPWVAGAAATPIPEEATSVAICKDQPLRLSATWSVSGLKNPESAVLSADASFLYVSMIDGEADAVDGQGQIARISLDGKILDAKWVKGLNAPKGLALRGDRLFASDLTELLEIDTKHGRVIQRYPVPEARFLNDVAVVPKGNPLSGDVLVSDSGRASITRFHQGEVQEWLRDDRLKSINGLLAQPKRLLISTMQGRLLAVDWDSRSITDLAENLGNGDGLADLGGNRFLVSEWPGQLFLVQPGEDHKVLLDTRAESRLLNDFLLIRPAASIAPTIIMPHLMPGAITAYRLDCQSED